MSSSLTRRPKLAFQHCCEHFLPALLLMCNRLRRIQALLQGQTRLRLGKAQKTTSVTKLERQNLDLALHVGILPLKAKFRQ